MALYSAGRFDESIDELRKVIEADPEFAIAYWFQGGNFLAKEMWDEAISSFHKFVDLTTGSTLALAMLGYTYGAAGIRDKAVEILRRFDELSEERYVGSFWRAFVWTGLGEKNLALENLEKAYQERESYLAFIKEGWIVFDSLRAEPGFQALLKKMNLDK